MSEGTPFSARCRIRIFAPEPVFGYFLQEQKVTRPGGETPLLLSKEEERCKGLRPLKKSSSAIWQRDSFIYILRLPLYRRLPLRL